MLKIIYKMQYRILDYMIERRYKKQERLREKNIDDIDKRYELSKKNKTRSRVIITKKGNAEMYSLNIF